MTAKIKEKDGYDHEDKIFGFVSHVGKHRKRGWFFTWPKKDSVRFEKSDIEGIIGSLQEEEFGEIEKLMSKAVAEKELRRF